MYRARNMCTIKVRLSFRELLLLKSNANASPNVSNFSPRKCWVKFGLILTQWKQKYTRYVCLNLDRNKRYSLWEHTRMYFMDFRFSWRNPSLDENGFPTIQDRKQKHSYFYWHWTGDVFQRACKNIFFWKHMVY